ncbi:MAG: efflux RND transporter permease subunit [Solimonas sp.]
MWIVRYALRHPHTVGAFAILIVLAGAMSLRRISTDVLPAVHIPSFNVVWYYPGLGAEEMAAKITSFSEGQILNNLDDIREVRAESTDGVGIVTVEFQPGVDFELAYAQLVGTSQTILKRMPRGTLPPSIIRVDPSSTPILNLVVSSDTLNDGQLYDYVRLQLRSQIKSIPGLRLTLPYGGAPRQIMVELDPARLQTHGLGANDVEAAIAAQNLTLPSGVLREGRDALRVTLNGSPEDGEAFEAMPIRVTDGRAVLLRDVATVRDGPAVQTNLARLDGSSAVVVSVIKMGDASTVDVVRRIHARLPELRAAAPEGVKIEALFDQSTFVEAAAQTVLSEVLLVACLVAAVVLLFIGSLRSTLIVLTSIPLALLCAVTGLYALGHTLNLMSLGGLALAIGLLVDNALVEIENSNRRIEAGEPVRTAILNSAREVVFPEFLSTLCICIVFIPIFMMTGVPAFIFKPLALAVVLAMAASFVLSRTLIPTLASMLLPAEQALHAARPPGAPPRGGAFGRLQQRFERRLVRWRDVHGRRLRRLDAHGGRVLLACALIVLLGVACTWMLGREFFPRTDAGMIRFYLRGAPSLRLEETARIFAEVQREIRATIPGKDLALVNEIIGQPDPINLAWVSSTVLGAFDGEVFVQLGPGHAPTARYQAALRRRLAERFPDLTLFFRPADSTNLTLAGTAPTDIDLRIVGKDIKGNRAAAATLMARMRGIPGLADVTLRQVFEQPELYVEIDRVRALELGVTQEQAADAVLSALGSGGSVAPTFWADAGAGTSYTVQILAPPLLLDSAEDLLNLPVRVGDDGRAVTLRAIARVSRRKSPATISRVMQAPALDVLANVQDRDLGGAVDALQPLLDDVGAKLKAGNRIELAGQPQVMEQAYRDLAGGLLLAIVLVFLVQVVNFQSWLLPLNALAGLPVALSGCALALKLSGTALSVPALMGAIMVVGVSTANSVLVISFARDRLAEGMSARAAARAATRARFRPVLMTATAMIIGVVPMAVGHGAGAEQNAPLGRAVVGGLLFGTAATLTIVPLLFGRVARRRQAHEAAGRQ